ncbi:hypothetical protein GLOIN_2v1738848 [Rhizophagus clarus]|uniref:Uncharacterized protein n=1 Tax=Rhizophagus clarus TaxID=94130 RepID=A0A8H3LBS0_9GLOM|nr:hypothetical protein GLOIN_2v1738848 [Rhizophagus clarus]
MGILWENPIPNAIMKLFQDEATHSTTDYNLPNFLENPISPSFYSEVYAGPDVITVACPVDSDDSAKFREKNEGDDVLLYYILLFSELIL